MTPFPVLFLKGTPPFPSFLVLKTVMHRETLGGCKILIENKLKLLKFLIFLSAEIVPDCVLINERKKKNTVCIFARILVK